MCHTDEYARIPYNTDEEELINLTHGGTVDVKSFAKQNQRLHDLRRISSNIAGGNPTRPYRSITGEMWANTTLTLRRRSMKSRKVSRHDIRGDKGQAADTHDTNQPLLVEELVGGRLNTVDADAIKDGDIVDIPVWMDVWYGPGDLKMPPWTILTFDRLVILREEAAKVRGPNVQTCY